MRRTVYGTWTQIQYVIKHNKSLKDGTGYDYYEVEQIPGTHLPTLPESGHPMEGNDFINYYGMFKPRNPDVRLAKQTKSTVEFFKITLFK